MPLGRPTPTLPGSDPSSLLPLSNYIKLSIQLLINFAELLAHPHHPRVLPPVLPLARLERPQHVIDELLHAEVLIQLQLLLDQAHVNRHAV